MQGRQRETIYPLSKCKEFLELPLTGGKEMVESRGLCRLYLTACGSKGKETREKRCGKESFPLAKEWCQELNKDQSM
jgi:hypothetical protein